MASTIKCMPCYSEPEEEQACAYSKRYNVIDSMKKIRAKQNRVEFGAPPASFDGDVGGNLYRRDADDSCRLAGRHSLVSQSGTSRIDRNADRGTLSFPADGETPIIYESCAFLTV